MRDAKRIGPIGFVAACLLGGAMHGTATADPAIVEAVELRMTGDTATFSVTLSHGDTGWDDYADGWRVVAADGTVLGERPLLHPHVNEQPFTRSVSGVAIPEGMDVVYIETRTNTDGWDTARFPVEVR